MTFENRAFGGNFGFDADAAVAQVEIDDAVDHLEVLETHVSRYAPLAATSSSIRAARFLSTKYCSVVALPSLTSAVHCSSGSLIPNALSIAKAMSRKSRLSMPRSLMAWLSGVIESRGMSHVSAIILAMVSNVEDIVNSLIEGNKRLPVARVGPPPSACSLVSARPHQSQLFKVAARIPKRPRTFNAERFS